MLLIMYRHQYRRRDISNSVIQNREGQCNRIEEVLSKDKDMFEENKKMNVIPMMTATTQEPDHANTLNTQYVA